MQPNNLYNICKFIIQYLMWTCIVLFCMGAVGVTVSMIDEYRLHKQINEMNERAKDYGKMDTNR